MKQKNWLTIFYILFSTTLYSSNLFASKKELSFKEYAFFQELDKAHPDLAELMLKVQEGDLPLKDFDLLLEKIAPQMTQSSQITMNEDGTNNPSAYIFSFDFIPPLGPDDHTFKHYPLSSFVTPYNPLQPYYNEKGQLFAPHSLKDTATVNLQYTKQIKAVANLANLYEVELTIVVTTGLQRDVHFDLPEPNLSEVDPTEKQRQSLVNLTQTISRSTSYLTTHSDGTPDKDALAMIDYVDRATKRLAKMEWEWAKKLYARHMTNKMAHMMKKVLEKSARTQSGLR